MWLIQPRQTRAHWGSEKMSCWQIERALMMRLAAPRKPGMVVSMDAIDRAQAGALQGFLGSGLLPAHRASPAWWSAWMWLIQIRRRLAKTSSAAGP